MGEHKSAAGVGHGGAIPPLPLPFRLFKVVETMAKIRRFTALFMALTVALTAFAVPIYATDYQSPYRFGNWAYTFLKDVIGWTPNARGWGQGVCPVSDDTMHHCSTYTDIDEDGLLLNPDAVFVATCDYCGNEFHGTATEVEEVYDEITPDYTIDDEGHQYFDAWQVKNYWPSRPMEIVSQIDGMVSAKMTVTFTSPCYAALYQIVEYEEDTIVNIDGKFVWSRTGTPEEIIDKEVAVKVKIEGGNSVTTTATDTGKYFTAVAGTQYRIYCEDTSFSSYGGGTQADWHYNVQYLQIYTPVISVSGSPPEISDLPVGFDGTITYTDVNGDEIIAENVFYDQSTNNFYNPATDTTIPVDGWEYDYSTRTYTGHTENGDVLITYGDENITVVEGGNTYNYYYGNGDATGSGSGSGSDDDNSGGGSGIWEKLGELLGTLLGGLIDLITGVIDGLLDSLISLVRTTLDKLGEVVNLFGSFGDALRSLWAWLPEEIITILTAGVSVVVFASVLKLFI